jgi:hypothetical protein
LEVAGDAESSGQLGVGNISEEAQRIRMNL